MARAGALALTTLSLITCAVDSPPSTQAIEQDVINTPLPSNLNPILNAKTSVAIGAFTQVLGDVVASGPSGSLLFDVSSTQSFGANALANTVRVQVGASAGHIFGNDLIVDGFAAQQTLGLDPATLPQVPATSVAAPGSTGVSVATNQTKQLCPGQYGAISLGTNARLNLNGGVYHLTRLSLAEGARLEPSEPVVLVVSGNVILNTGTSIRPSDQSIGPMSSADIRIEVGGAVTIGEGAQVRAHLLVPNGKLATGKNTTLVGAAWARSISIGTQNVVGSDGVFSAQAPSVPPPCNDRNACTTDQCVTSGTVAFCRNTPAPSGTSCDDGNLCNGTAACNGAGACVAGAPPTAGTSCADGNACNGDETCDGIATCVPGAPPVVDDGNTCTTDACNPATGVSHDPLPDGTTCGGSGVCEGGTCSIEAQTLMTINDANGHLERIDPLTLAVTDVGPLNVGYAFGDCAFHPVDNVLYMVDGRAARGLFRVNTLTGAATLVGIHGLNDLFSLAYHPPTNKLYGIDGNGDFYSISTTTGAATFIGPTSIGFFVDGIAFDSTRNQLIALTAGASTFFSIDVATGRATALASTSFVNDHGMTYDPSIDRFWVIDFSGFLLQFDPGASFARSTLAVGSTPHTCLALTPAP